MKISKPNLLWIILCGILAALAAYFAFAWYDMVLADADCRSQIRFQWEREKLIRSILIKSGQHWKRKDFTDTLKSMRSEFSVDETDDGVHFHNLDFKFDGDKLIEITSINDKINE